MDASVTCFDIPLQCMDLQLVSLESGGAAKVRAATGFSGEIRAEEDKGLPLNYTRVYTLRPSGGVVKVPYGFFSLHPPPPYRVVGIVDTSGRAMSKLEVRIIARGGGKLPPGAHDFFVFTPTP
jgi:hypothetical protein